MISLAELYEGAVGARDPVQSERERLVEFVSRLIGRPAGRRLPQIARIFGVELANDYVTRAG